jgi:hypothetical protein
MVEAEEEVVAMAEETHAINLAATAHMPTMVVAMMALEVTTETVIETNHKDN